MYMRAHTQAKVSKHIHTHMHTHKYIHVHMYAYIHTYIYIYTYIHTRINNTPAVTKERVGVHGSSLNFLLSFCLKVSSSIMGLGGHVM